MALVTTMTTMVIMMIMCLSRRVKVDYRSYKNNTDDCYYYNIGANVTIVTDVVVDVFVQ